MPRGNTHRIWFNPSRHGFAVRVYISLLRHEVVRPLTLAMHMLIAARPERQFHIPAENCKCYTEVCMLPCLSSLFLEGLKCFTKVGQAQCMASGRRFSWEVVSMPIRQGKQLNPDLHLVV